MVGNGAQGSKAPNDPRIYFAAERTLLAWIRTGLAMMGFGFVVARFGLFLHEIAAARGVSPPEHRSLSLWIGTALVLLGVVVDLCAVAMHARTLRRLDKGQTLDFHVLSLGTVVGMLLGVLGLLVTTYLLYGLGSAR